jgi:hypothetical protein
MPGPNDDKQYPKRITLPTLDNKMGRYEGGAGKPPFMNTKNVGVNATPNATTFGQRTNGVPFAGGGPLPAQISSGGKSFMPNGSAVTYNPSLFPQGGGPTNPAAGPGGASFNRIFSMQNPFIQGMGGVIGAGLRMRSGQPPFAGGGMGGAPGMSALEMQFRDRYDKAIGPGAWDNFVKTRGMTPIDFYRMPNNRYWEDGPSTPDRALDDAIRDEFNNARNAAQWQQEHGNVAIPQEAWDRWYYANRQGMRVDDVMNDGSEVVY